MSQISFSQSKISNIENILFSIPKSCNCPICMATKQMAIDTLGESKFKKLCSELNIVH